jgi:hypothetical protein
MCRNMCTYIPVCVRLVLYIDVGGHYWYQLFSIYLCAFPDTAVLRLLYLFTHTANTYILFHTHRQYFYTFSHTPPILIYFFTHTANTSILFHTHRQYFYTFPHTPPILLYLSTHTPPILLYFFTHTANTSITFHTHRQYFYIFSHTPPILLYFFTHTANTSIPFHTHRQYFYTFSHTPPILLYFSHTPPILLYFFTHTANTSIPFHTHRQYFYSFSHKRPYTFSSIKYIYYSYAHEFPLSSMLSLPDMIVRLHTLWLSFRCRCIIRFPRNSAHICMGVFVWDRTQSVIDNISNYFLTSFYDRRQKTINVTDSPAPLF